MLTVKKDGSVFLANVEVPIDTLEDKMVAILEGRPDKEVYLRADKEAPYGAVVKAMAAARAGGAKSLGIVTEPE
jgi:biopolymer transport protein TolR